MAYIKKNTKLIDGYSSFDSNLLINRGITTKEQADKFFNDTFYDLDDYWNIKGYRECIYFLKEEIDNKKKIMIFGDYDTDGVTSTNILYEGFSTLGADVSWRLPCRMKEGYGIKLSAVKEIVSQGYELIITVDNGIRANEPIKYAREHGVDVVILDHHILGKEVPCANHWIDLHREDETYSYREFAGCGVAFMVMRGLYFLYGYDDDYCKRHLDMVAIGTIADIMELTGENRILVKEGLKIINDTINYDRPGIQALIKLQCLTKELTVSDIGYKIAPCLNAPGRLLENGANLALELTLSKEAKDAMNQAGYVYRINEYRQEKEREGAILADEYIDSHGIQNDNIILVYLEGLSEGLIGLISGRITKKYNRPSIVFTKNAVGNLKASARSIPTIDLFECLCSCDGLYVGYGGHSQAAGLEILPENLEILREGLNDYIENNYDKDVFDTDIYYEYEIKEEEIDNRFYEKLKKYEPCGNANPSPILYIKEFNSVQKKIPKKQEISHFQMFGDGGIHFKLFGENGDVQGFSLGEKYMDMGCPKTISCIFTLDKSSMAGDNSLILNAIDIDKPIMKQFVQKNETVINEIKNLASLL